VADRAPGRLVLVALLLGSLSASATANFHPRCVHPGELSLGGVALRASRQEVERRLGPPAEQSTVEQVGKPLSWEDVVPIGAAPRVRLAYPGLEIDLGERDTVVRVATRSDRYALPSGVRVGMPREEVRARMRLEVSLGGLAAVYLQSCSRRRAAALQLTFGDGIASVPPSPLTEIVIKVVDPRSGRRQPADAGRAQRR
jgi:hypothetical protein